MPRRLALQRADRLLGIDGGGVVIMIRSKGLLQRLVQALLLRRETLRAPLFAQRFLHPFQQSRQAAIIQRLKRTPALPRFAQQPLHAVIQMLFAAESCVAGGDRPHQARQRIVLYRVRFLRPAQQGAGNGGCRDAVRRRAAHHQQIDSRLLAVAVQQKCAFGLPQRRATRKCRGRQVEQIHIPQRARAFQRQRQLSAQQRQLAHRHAERWLQGVTVDGAYQHVPGGGAVLMLAQQEAFFRQGEIVDQQAERRGDAAVETQQLQGFRQPQPLRGELALIAPQQRVQLAAFAEAEMRDQRRKAVPGFHLYAAGTHTGTAGKGFNYHGQAGGADGAVGQRLAQRL